MPANSQPRSQDRVGGGVRGGRTETSRQNASRTTATTTGNTRPLTTEELASEYDQLIATEPEKAKKLCVDALQERETNYASGRARLEGRVGDLEHRLGAVQEAVKIDLPITERRPATYASILGAAAAGPPTAGPRPNNDDPQVNECRDPAEDQLDRGT